MCGIAAVYYHSPVSAARAIKDCVALSMNMVHRGPDDEGFLLVDETFQMRLFHGNDSASTQGIPHISEASGTCIFAMVHRRLSIIGIGQAGHQPMVLADNNVSLVYNGETFNFKELNNKYGFSNDSRTDTETVLKLFLKNGKDAPNEMNGFFAGILFNQSEKSVTVFRDSTGVKPLFVHSGSDYTCYCSDTRAIRAVSGANVLSSASFVHYLAEGIVHSGAESTMFQDIVEFPKGRVYSFTLTDGSEIDSKQIQFSQSQMQGTLRQQLVSSIEKRLVSDVPLGFAVSGGLDSALIIGIARKLMPDAQLKAFSIVSNNPAADESAWQKQVVDYNHANWTKVNLNHSDPDLLIDTIRNTDLPAVAWNNLAHFELCRTVKANGVTVLFNGQGADELFGGYPDYLQRAYFANFFAVKKSKNWPISNSEMRSGWLKMKLQSSLPNSMIQKLYFNKFADLVSDDLVFEHSLMWSKSSLSAEEKMYDDYYGMKLGQMLMWEDKNGMAHSLESRNPFADDPTLAEYLNMNLAQKSANGYTKGILRDAAVGFVPESVLWRVDKKGFTVPDSELTWKHKERWKDAFFSAELNDFSPLFKRQRLWNSLTEGNSVALRNFFRLTAYSLFIHQLKYGQK